MKLMIEFDIESPEQLMDYEHPIFLIGSCFTEHIGNSLKDMKLQVLQNPHGNIYDPSSVTDSLLSYVRNRKYLHDDLVKVHDLWHSWSHHGRFSSPDREEILQNVNRSQAAAHEFLSRAEWLIITLGTSYSYILDQSGRSVANCHRAPSEWFRKHLMSIEEINSAFDNCFHQLLRFNPKLKIIFTVSPVRHIRDGVVENNRSKARLLEAVHHLVNKFDRLYYFPAYELVIDVLRDYRFFDEDLVHPNKLATNFVLEQFVGSYFNVRSKKIAEEVKKIVASYNHRPFNSSTEAHKKFLKKQLEQTTALKRKYPFLNLDDEINYFGSE